MKKFIKHLLLYYSIPFLLYFLFLLPTAITKIILLKKVANTSEKYMFTPIDESDIYTFKINNIKKNNYDVIVFGSSRVNTFTEEMFSEEIKFYNLCHMGEGNKNIYNLLHLILEYQHPRVIILGIDQWTFNNKWNNSIQALSV